MSVSYQLSGDSCQDGDAIAVRLEAGQEADPTAPFHYYIGLDFQPVAEGMPDDDTAVFMLVSDNDDDPVFIGFRDGGHWFYSDGTAVGATRNNRVTHWAHKPEFAGVHRSGTSRSRTQGGVAEFLASLDMSGLKLSYFLPAREEEGRPA
jgi:hypothetical protein